MADVRPFRGWRFDPSRVDVGAASVRRTTSSLPQEQRAYHERDPHNVVRVELGLGSTDPEAPGQPLRGGAAQALADWRDEGTLIQDPRPAVYLYEQPFRQRDGQNRPGAAGCWPPGACRTRRRPACCPTRTRAKGPSPTVWPCSRRRRPTSAPCGSSTRTATAPWASALAGAWEGHPVAVGRGGRRDAPPVGGGRPAPRCTRWAAPSPPARCTSPTGTTATRRPRSTGTSAAVAGRIGDAGRGYEFALMLLGAPRRPGTGGAPQRTAWCASTAAPRGAVRAALAETMTLEPSPCPKATPGPSRRP